jgi:hypothetical protein
LLAQVGAVVKAALDEAPASACICDARVTCLQQTSEVVNPATGAREVHHPIRVRARRTHVQTVLPIEWGRRRDTRRL